MRTAFANYDPDTSSWKTSQLSLLEGSTEFSETWPRSGTMRGGTAFLRQPLAPLTDATAFSLSRLAPTLIRSIPTPRPCTGLRSSGANRTEIQRSLVPTPTATDAANSRRESAVRNKEWSSNAGTTLLDFADPTNGGRLIPTPKASDGERGGRGDLLAIVRGKPNAHSGAALLPTPEASNTKATGLRSAGREPKAFAGDPSISGALNPEWVEWLQGFPIGWTDCAA